MKITFNNKMQKRKHGRPMFICFNENEFFIGTSLSKGIIFVKILESFKPNTDWGFESVQISLAEGFGFAIIDNPSERIFNACKNSKNWLEVAQILQLPENIVKDFVHKFEPRWANEVDNKLTDDTCEFEEFIVELRKPSRQEGWQNVVINNEVFDNANCKKLDGIATLISFGESEKSQHVKVVKLLVKRGVTPQIKTEQELENEGWFCQNSWGSFKWFPPEN